MESWLRSMSDMTYQNLWVRATLLGKHLAECITTVLTHRCVKAESQARWVILESFSRDQMVCIILRSCVV